MLHTTGVQRVGKVQSRILKFLVVKWKEVTVGFFSIIFQITKNDCETANFLITLRLISLICISYFLFAISFFNLRFLFFVCVFSFLFAFSFFYLRFLFLFLFDPSGPP